MSTVTEIVDAYPGNEPLLHIERNEQLLFAKPGPPVSNFLQKYPLLQAFHYITEYTPMKFAPPRDVFQNKHVRIEWQNMNQRQPFYHRNADVDEISFHLTGERTLITERGSVDLRPGDFARIPVYTAHDNRGVDDVHLIFYLSAPAKEDFPASASTRKTEFKIPPFAGWEPRPIPEVITECLGAVGCDRAYSLVDEELLLSQKNGLDPINVVNVYELEKATGETHWLYKSENVWLGSTVLSPNKQNVYRRHRNGDEIQCQVKGSRTLITQRGTIRLESGDFVSIPIGTAFTSIVTEESTHLSVLTKLPAERKGDNVRAAEETIWNAVQKLQQ